MATASLATAGDDIVALGGLLCLRERGSGEKFQERGVNGDLERREFDGFAVKLERGSELIEVA